MNYSTTLDDKTMIEKLLARMRDRKPGISADKVKVLIASIGREIERGGSVSEEYVEQLLRQLKNGDL